MEEKIEDIYNFTVSSILKGTNFKSCAEAVSEYLWNKYQKNAVH